MYKTVFDLASQNYDPSFAAFGLIFIVVPLAIIIWHRSQGIPLGRRNKTLCGFMLVFATLWTGVSFATTYFDYRNCKDALENGTATLVEGTVENFVPMPYTGHAMESFAVNGHNFSYSDYVITPGYHQSASHGGYIRPGLKVRIREYNGKILRLEVFQGS